MIEHKAISGLGYGCVGLATYRNLAHSLDLLNLAFEMGITHFDTAPIYSKGYSEKIVGLFSKDKRDKIQIFSKFGLGDISQNIIPISLAMSLNGQKKQMTHFEPIKPDANIIYRRIDQKQIDKNLYSSLKRLKTDYLDCFLLHEGISSFLTDESKFYLLNLKKVGKVKKIGLAANFYHTQQDPDLNFWDTLQYENCPLHYNSDEFIQEYPKQDHIYHSCLKLIKKFPVKNIAQKDYAGLVLAYQQQKNPNGKILFATGDINHLKDNIETFHRYSKEPKAHLKNIFDHALS